MTTIDYKALAERIEAIAKRQIDGARLSAAQENDEQAKRFEERAADLRTVVSLLEWMAEQEPVGEACGFLINAQHVQWRPNYVAQAGDRYYLHPAPQPRHPTPEQEAALERMAENARELRLDYDEAQSAFMRQFPAARQEVAEMKSWMGESAKVATLTFPVERETQPQPDLPQKLVETMREMADERQPVSEPTEVQTCLWWRDGDEDSDTWGTSCGNFFTLNEGDAALAAKPMQEQPK